MKIQFEQSNLIESRKARKRITAMWVTCYLALGCFTAWYAYMGEMESNASRAAIMQNALGMKGE
jgi:hypothetical protein